MIDGGKGQVGVAAEVLAEQGLHQTALIGIAKGPERKPGLEEIVFPDRAEPLDLPPDHAGPAPAAADSRRGASLRDPGPSRAARKARTTSSLQEIAGIGSKKRQALLAHFGGLRGVQAASIDDLARAPGISRALAERIYARAALSQLKRRATVRNFVRSR